MLMKGYPPAIRPLTIPRSKAEPAHGAHELHELFAFLPVNPTP